MSSLKLQVGQTIELNDGRTAIIRFHGDTGFAPGNWVGIELDNASGKNDGSVKGQRYFDCEPEHGMFLRATGISRIIEEPQAQARPVSESLGNGAPTGKSRPSIVGAGPTKTAANVTKKESMAASPTPSRLGGLRSPTKSPTKAQSSASSVATSRTNTPPITGTRTASTAAAKPRPSLAPPTTQAGRRTSTAPSTSAGTRSARPSVGGRGLQSVATNRGAPVPLLRQNFAPQRNSRSSSARLSSVSGEDVSDVSSQISSVLSPGSEKETSRAHTPDEQDGQEADEDVEQTPRAPVAPAPAAPVPAVPDAPPEQDPQALKPALRRSPSPRPQVPREATARRTSSPPASIISSRTGRSTAASTRENSREVEELKTKLRMLEKRRLEDREKLKTLERIQQERDRFESIIQKLQQKYQPQQQELTDLKKQLKESESRFVDIESIQAEHDAELENATLDREMAEEQYEVLKTEVTALREKNEEMELEIEVLNEENQELGKEMSPEERTSQGWVQLERSNERLREALLRLRDVTQEQETELREQIKGLEKDSEELQGARAEAESLKERLLEGEAAIDDLRQRLEVAQGGEEMIEELSERNMALQDQLEELKATVEDLENLKELNDELDVNHVEAEKQMQEEIDFKDSLINEQARRSNEQQKAIDDYEMTVARFREAFRTLQGDLEDMRASQQISETEAGDLSSKSRALMDLNMKLQSSATKTQVKAIDLETKRMEAEEAAQHLAIVQMFLPEAFKAERDSILALLRFRRIAFKSHLVHNIVKEKINSHGYAEDDVFAALGVLDKLACISAMSERFIDNISACSVSEFTKYQGTLYELEPVERGLNSYIEALRRDEFRAAGVDGDLQRSSAVMSHLASLHIQDSPASFADDVVMRTSMLQTHLETTTSALAMYKSRVEARAPPQQASEEDDEGIETLDAFFARADSLMTNVRGAKVIAGRAHRELAELRTRSLGLGSSTLQTFVSAETQASKISAFARIAGETIMAMPESEDGVETLSLSKITHTLSQAATQAFDLKTADTDPLTTMSIHLRSLIEQINTIASLSSDLSHTHEFSRPESPWILRAAELRSDKTHSADTEAQLARLNTTLHERTLLVRNKEQELEEQGVRIEMLEARAKDASKRTAQIEELEKSLETFKASEKKAKEGLEKHARDASRLRTERDEQRRKIEEFRSAEGVAKSEGLGITGVMGRASKVELERARMQVKGLEGTVRWLQKEKEVLKRGKEDMELEWLSEPLIKSPSEKQQRAALVRLEGRDVLYELLQMMTRAKEVDLKTLPRDKLAWRPVKETSRWTTVQRREEWESWKEWRSDVLGKAEALVKPPLNTRASRLQRYGLPDGGNTGKLTPGLHVVDESAMATAIV